MLEAGIVTIQNYKAQPSVRHFWVYCSFCAMHKLYWPTARQIVVADALNCASLTDDVMPPEILASYERDLSLSEAWVEEPEPAVVEVGFLLNMLAATSGVDPRPSPLQSYLPSHWSN